MYGQAYDDISGVEFSRSAARAVLSHAEAITDAALNANALPPSACRLIVALF